MTTLPPDLLDIIRRIAGAELDITNADDIEADAAAGRWYTEIARQAYELGQASRDRRIRLLESQHRADIGLIDRYRAETTRLRDKVDQLTREAHELPTLTLPWTGYAGHVEVDEDGDIDIQLGTSGVPLLDADSATEFAAALLAAARVSRDITGERPMVTLHAPALEEAHRGA